MIGILDYGMGNLRSVQKAFERLDGPKAVVLERPQQMVGCEKIVLPGVGNFADGMRQLHERSYVPAIHDFIATGRPLLGVCLGMQLLLTDSTEDAGADGPTRGLDAVPGRVVRFAEDQGPDRRRLKVPHMGWNRLTPVEGSPLFAGLGPEPYVYFVHGYHCEPADADALAATADYGQPFCAALHAGNVWGMQFHPEKSQHVGLKLLQNFASL
jgi:glutamine amidotransferase